MDTLPVSLDGYTDLPPGKIANIVTYLEMSSRPAQAAEPERSDLDFRRIRDPDAAWYRATIRAVGEPWLWFSPLVMSEAQLLARLRDPLIEIHALERAGETAGIAVLDRRTADQVEISFFGVVPSEIGTGAARFLMQRTLAAAFRSGPVRVWLHTCTFDHPAAVPFYLRAGFTPFKFAIEVTDDPRLAGHIPEDAAPHVALVRPGPDRRPR